VAALDLSYDLTERWTLGGKYAYRLGQASLERVDPQFFENSAHLVLVRADWRFLEGWEGMIEARALELPDLDERRGGALLAVYRYVGRHFKVGPATTSRTSPKTSRTSATSTKASSLNAIGAM
jgi:hypothetical protein